MPPRRNHRGSPAIRNVEEQGVPNAHEVQPKGSVTHSKLREAITMPSEVVTNKVG